MSHVVEAKTSIHNPNVALLQQAVELVAHQHEGGRLSARLALFTSVIHRGIGIIVKDSGQLTFKGDPYGYEAEAEAVQQQILQTYVSLATMQALQQMGYQTTAEDGVEGQVYLTGVSNYA